MGAEHYKAKGSLWIPVVYVWDRAVSQNTLASALVQSWLRAVLGPEFAPVHISFRLKRQSSGNTEPVPSWLGVRPVQDVKYDGVWKKGLYQHWVAMGN
jgi:hypothetical protein